MKINNCHELSLFLKNNRKLSKKTQGQLGEAAQIQQQSISAFEKHCDHSRIDTLYRLINALDLELHLIPKGAPLASEWKEEW